MLKVRLRTRFSKYILSLTPHLFVLLVQEINNSPDILKDSKLRLFETQFSDEDVRHFRIPHPLFFWRLPLVVTYV